MAQILWPIVDALEYPDLRFLDDVLNCLDFPHDPKQHPIGMRVVDENYVQMSNVDKRYSFVRRLEAQGLLLTEDLSKPLGSVRSVSGDGGALRGNRMIGFAPTGIGRQIREFALEEFWREPPADEEPPARAD